MGQVEDRISGFWDKIEELDYLNKDHEKKVNITYERNIKKCGISWKGQIFKL